MSLSAPVRIVATYLHKNEADLRKNLVSKSFDGLGPFANALIADGTLLETGRRRIYSRTSLEAQFTACDTNATCTALMIQPRLVQPFCQMAHPATWWKHSQHFASVDTKSETSSPSSMPHPASVDTMSETIQQPAASTDTITYKDSEGSDTDRIQLNEPFSSGASKMTHQIGINTQKADLKLKKHQLEVTKEKAKFFFQLVGSGVDEKSSSEKADA
ncbi:hypothetical protein BCR33DRAFT_848744 [Rhizoclosmatium globosum]|uniref:Uncharacterized protein n=1 Tax=Rhizoclosmatium globosum TaxID=329046 RepID=A0A1Y2CM08_9FUNG|nr:hypothetical protein BCR33DRAFT_848744 [Rhizoclosmatium globosum]|eukprot:ORY47395.1 hypothetical protein BCR33DRAFT_848744 [Rhizoclosmatium globosum]